MATRHLDVLPAGPAAQVEIQLGHVCNNRCVFCVSGQRTAQGLAHPLPAAPALAALDEAAARGARTVTFLGGEPTLQASLVPAIAHAIDRGFREIVLFTNGVKTARAGYIDEILALGAATGFAGFVWRFSIQGGDEAAHDAVTQKPGSFRRLVAGLHHLAARGQHVTANACINERSYRSLPGYVDLVRTHGIRQLHLDQVRPRDAGVRSDDELRAMMPRYSEMVPYFRAMLDRFDRELGPDYDVNVGNFPFCLMPERAAKIHHDGEPTLTVAADGDQLSRPWDKYADKRRDKFHPPACASCSFRPRCNGVFTHYAQFHGVDEFVPVPAPAPARSTPPPMKYRTLPGTDLQLSALGLDCAGTEDLDGTIAEALALGVDWFDAAPEHETRVARALGARRHDVVIATRVAADDPAGLRAAIEASLRRLGLDALPLLQLVGAPSRPLLAELAGLRRAGKLRHVGLYNPRPADLLLARDAGVVAVQTPYSVARRDFEAGLRAMCIGTGPEGQPVQRLGVLARVADDPAPAGVALALRAVAARVHAPAAALALAWVLRRPGVSVALVRARDRACLRGCAHALGLLARPGVWQALAPHLDVVGP
jgi:aryl-alcohol dehydrogenase-like predicted oxidoreductase/MoaA/NifB/PqqE/SkfB family radical SAM enzyme